jgi:hypothetical protein
MRKRRTDAVLVDSDDKARSGLGSSQVSLCACHCFLHPIEVCPVRPSEVPVHSHFEEGGIRCHGYCSAALLALISS